MKTVLAPVLFISHGSPTFALEPGLLGPRLQALFKDLPALQAVLVVSPHWQTRTVRVMSTAKPQTIHDFGGFPAALYQLQYPADGHPEMAAKTLDLLLAEGWDAALDDQRGLDHGAWVPLLHLLPQVNVPVFQVSMPLSLSTRQAFELGQALAPLREQGVLIVGSGSMTHNLRDIRTPDSAPELYALAFASWVRNALLAGDSEQVIGYRKIAPLAEHAHPTEEHLLPLLVALGAQSSKHAKNAAPAVQAIEGGVTYGVLSMDSYVWGMPARAGV